MVLSSLPELVIFNTLNGTIEYQHITVGGRFEYEHILEFTLLDVQDFVDLKSRM